MSDQNDFEGQKEKNSRNMSCRKSTVNYRIGMTPNIGGKKNLEANQMTELSPDTPTFGPPPGINRPADSGEGENVPSNPGENLPAEPGKGILPTPSLPGGTWFPAGSGGAGNNSWPPIAVYPIPILPGMGVQQGYCTIRFLNAVIGQGPVNISIGNRPVVHNLEYGELSSYFIETAGLKSIRVTDPVQRPILARETFMFNRGDCYTIALINGINGMMMFPIPDTPCRTARGMDACVRAINLSYNSPALNVVMLPSRVLFEDLRFKEVPPYRQVTEGEQRIDVSETISGAEVFQKEEWMEAGKIYTLYILGDAYGDPEMSGIFVEDISSLEGYL